MTMKKKIIRRTIEFPIEDVKKIKIRAKRLHVTFSEYINFLALKELDKFYN